jgi:hypothetical protein
MATGSTFFCCYGLGCYLFLTGPPNKKLSMSFSKWSLLRLASSAVLIEKNVLTRSYLISVSESSSTLRPLRIIYVLFFTMNQSLNEDKASKMINKKN